MAEAAVVPSAGGVSNSDSPQVSWSRAVKAYDEGDIMSSLDLFQTATNAHALYNSAMILSRLDRPDEAAQKLTEALEKNSYLAVAYYRRGYIRFQQKRYEEAIADFESCGNLIRSKHIDYTQMGLAFKLNSSDVNFNTGLCYFVSGNQVKGMELLLKAQKDSGKKSSMIVEKTLNALEKGEGDFNPTLIPTSEPPSIFRPLKSQQEKPIDFLGKQRVIASSGSGNKSSTEDLSQLEGKDDKESSIEAMVYIPPPPANPPPRRPPNYVKEHL